MEDLKQEYLLLFNGITDTIYNLETMIYRLRALQQEAEIQFIEGAQEQSKTRYYPGPRAVEGKDAANE